MNFILGVEIFNGAPHELRLDFRIGVAFRSSSASIKDTNTGHYKVMLQLTDIEINIQSGMILPSSVIDL